MLHFLEQVVTAVGKGLVVRQDLMDDLHARIVAIGMDGDHAPARPDRAGEALPRVHAPTLLIVGSADMGVIELNEQALAAMHGAHRLEIVRGATEYVQKKNPAPSIPEGGDKTELIAWRGATRAQACDAARPLLPVAVKSTVGIVASSQALEAMVRRLLVEPLEERPQPAALGELGDRVAAAQTLAVGL